jgi:hypothetical protein
MGIYHLCSYMINEMLYLRFELEVYWLCINLILDMKNVLNTNAMEL